MAANSNRSGSQPVWCIPQNLFSRGGGERRIKHIHQRAFQVFVGRLFAQYWCIDFWPPNYRQTKLVFELTLDTGTEKYDIQIIPICVWGNGDHAPENIAGIQSTTLFGDHPFSIKHPQDNFGLQNVNWHPPKCKLTPSKKGLTTSNLQVLYRNTQKSPLDNLYFGGRQFAFWRLKLSWGGGGLYRKGGTPQKGGTLAFPQNTQVCACSQDVMI